MRNRLTILLLTTLLLAAVSYGHVFQKMVEGKRIVISVINDTNGDAEENTEKSSEENPRETDQDEDPLKLNDLMAVSFASASSILKNGDYSLGLFGFYPEIVSPPPQG
jgi:hypothetical protein